eukprot:94242_1
MTNGNVLNWTQSNVNVTATRYGFIGYSMDSNDIWILGGPGTTTTLVQFKPETQTTIINVTNTSYGYCAAQCWTQLGEALYMLPFGAASINIFNLSTKSFINFGNTYPGTAEDKRCMASFDKYFVSVGGYDGYTYVKEVLLYDIAENAWSNGSDLLSVRAYATCHIVNNILYVIGGWNHVSDALNTVETISTSDLIGTQNTWITMTDTLSEGKVKHRSTVYKDLIYVVGGWNINSGGTLKSVDIINTLTQSIVPDSDLLTANYHQQIIIVNDILYSFGGCCGPIQYQYAIISTYTPTDAPSNSSPAPTANPTAAPTNNPTKTPTTPNPTHAPTPSPSRQPTPAPTTFPTEYPTKYPTKSPTKYPTKSPTTISPTLVLNSNPTFNPTYLQEKIDEEYSSTLGKQEIGGKKDYESKVSILTAVVIVLGIALACVGCAGLLYIIKKWRNKKRKYNENVRKLKMTHIESNTNGYVAPNI